MIGAVGRAAGVLAKAKTGPSEEKSRWRTTNSRAPPSDRSRPSASAWFRWGAANVVATAPVPTARGIARVDRRLEVKDRLAFILRLYYPDRRAPLNGQKRTSSQMRFVYWLCR